MFYNEFTIAQPNRNPELFGSILLVFCFSKNIFITLCFSFFSLLVFATSRLCFNWLQFNLILPQQKMLAAEAKLGFVVK